jgi:hypothetical protein
MSCVTWSVRADVQPRNSVGGLDPPHRLVARCPILIGIPFINHGTGSTASACSTRRWKSLPRDRDVRQLKPERELVEVIVQMCGADRALVRAKQPPLEQGRDQVHAGERAGRQSGVLGDGHAVAIAFRGQARMALPPVGVDQAVGFGGLTMLLNSSPRRLGCAAGECAQCLSPARPLRTESRFHVDQRTRELIHSPDPSISGLVESTKQPD